MLRVGAITPTYANMEGNKCIQHTWSEDGPLGLKIIRRGEDEDAPDGVIVSEVRGGSCYASLCV